MHWVQALIAPVEVLGEVQRRIPSAVICTLPQGLALIPITKQVEDELRDLAFEKDENVVAPSGEMASGLARFATELSSIGSIVYAATFFHGGAGGQDALVWARGELVLCLGDDEESPFLWPDSPISRALRHIGVIAQEGKDEFDAIGLGRYRSNEAWANAHALPSHEGESAPQP